MDEWKEHSKTTFPAAATEYLFRSVSPLVIIEAEQQLRLVFGNVSTIPEDLVTVHMTNIKK